MQVLKRSGYTKGRSCESGGAERRRSLGRIGGGGAAMAASPAAPAGSAPWIDESSRHEGRHGHGHGQR